VQGNIQPAPNCILGRVLPGLQSIVMAEIVRRFPVIERLVAVLYRGIEGSKKIGDEEDIESPNWLDCERSRWPG
jgi:hypothetical protein